MACKMKPITFERVPPNSVIFRGACDGTCDAETQCKPRFVWDTSNPKNKNGKVTMSFQPFGGGEAVIEITAESDIDDGDLIFSCVCPDKDGKESSVQGHNTLTLAHQTTITDVLGRLVDVLSVGLKPLIQHFLNREPTTLK
jgi:hypothetical protein